MRHVTFACVVLPAAWLLSGVADDLRAGPERDPPRVRELIQRLRSEDIRVRLEAARQLEARGGVAQAAIPALIEALDDTQLLAVPGAEPMQAIAARTLHRLGPPAARALAAAALRHPRESVRNEALRLVCECRLSAAVPVLLAGLRDQKVQAVAARALCRVDPDEFLVPRALLPGGRALDAFVLTALRGGDANAVEDALAVLERRGTRKEAIPLLLAHRQNEEFVCTPALVRSLARVGAGDRRVVLALAEIAAGLDADCALPALAALGDMGPSAAPAVPALLKLLRRGLAGRDDPAALTLGRIGPPARAAIPLLVEAFDRKDVSLLSPEVAAEALGGFRTDAGVVIPALEKALRRNLPNNTSDAAAASLARLGKAGVAALTRAAESDSFGPAWAATRALGDMGPAAAAARPVLRACLKKGGSLRTETALALALIDPDSATTLVPEVLKGMKDKSGGVLAAVEALHRLGPAARAAVPDLIDVLESKHEDLRGEAAAALGAIGKGAAGAVPALRAALRDPSPKVRWAAAGALGRIGPAARAAIPALVTALADPHPGVRVSAAFALGHLGRAARPAIPALVKSVTAAHPLQRWASLTALRRLGPDAVGEVSRLTALVGDGQDAGWMGTSRAVLPGSLPWDNPWKPGDAWLDNEDVPARTAYRADGKVPLAVMAIRALAAVGPEARAAVPALLRSRQDDRVPVRLAAVAALRAIDPAALTRVAPTSRELKRFWAELGGTDDAKAYRTFWSLVIAPEQAVPWLREHLEPAAPIDPTYLARLVRELDDERFAVRDKAGEALLGLGELVKPALAKALAGRPSLELRRRVEDLLQRLEDQGAPPDQLRALRAVAILDRIGTPEARRVLAALTKGAPEARLTRDAQAALRPFAERKATLRP